MKRLLLILSILSGISVNAQRIIQEECIGTTNNERIFATHENDDSTVTFLYRQDGYFYTDSLSESGHKIIVLKLDKNKNVLIQKQMDSIYYNLLESESYFFEKDGSFLLVSFNAADPAAYSTIAEKYDKNGNKEWQSDNLYSTLNYAEKYSIVKNPNGGYIIYTNALITSISETGQSKWSKEISTHDMFPGNYIMSDTYLDIIPKQNNKTFISALTMRYGYMSIERVFLYNMVLDSSGNTIVDDTIAGSNLFFYYSGSKDKRNNEIYELVNLNDSSILSINTDNLTLTNTYNPYGYPIGTSLLFPGIVDDQSTLTSNTFFVNTILFNNSQTVIVRCVDSNLNVLWSYTFDSAQLNNNSGAIIINDSTLFFFNTLLTNGRVIWQLNHNNRNDTISYNGNYYLYANYSGNSVNSNFGKLSLSKSNHNNINIFSLYSYNYCTTFCENIDLYRFQVVDILTGSILQDILIDHNVGSINYLKSINDKESFLASTNTDICRLGENDIYMATYSNVFNTIKGIAYIDYNNNNTKETNEPFYAYGYANTISVRDTQSQHLSINYPFSFFTDTGTYTTALHLYNDYYNITPPEFNTSHNTYGNSDTVLFALQPKPDKNDVSIQLVNNWHTRLGLNNSYTVSVENRGTTIANGKVKVLMDSRLLNVTTTPNYSYRIGDTLVWNIGNLAPLQTGMATINFAASVPSVLNAGDTIISKAWYESDSVDLTPADNYAEVKETVRASYDPNEKAITSGETLTPQQISNGSYISYIIHFQNKGNDTAFKVIILDTLSENLDVNSLQIINASAPYTLEIIHKKILKFTFENIRLPYDTTSISSTGYIAYKIKPLNTLAAGNTINNTAEIFFDFNPPVKTNTVQTKILLVSAVHQNKGLEGKMSIFPNPNTGVFTVSFENKGNSTIQLQLTDITGALIFNESRQHQNKTAFTIDESNLAKGIYWIKLSDGNDVYSSAVIVQ